ncbi:MAG: radical SAM protein [Endomicrobiaceae bacterium]|nr:radical SAM protein [Endomicrobiaceae bacterium]
MDNLKDTFEKIRQLNITGESEVAFKILSDLADNNSGLKKDPIFILEMAQTLLGMSKFNEALKCFQKVLDTESNNIYAKKGILKSTHKLNQPIQLEFLKEIFELDKDDVDIKNILSDLLIKNRQSNASNNPIYCLKNSQLIDKEQIISAINYILNSSAVLNKEIVLFDAFIHIITNNKILYPDTNLTEIIDIILSYIHIFDYDRETELKKNIFKYYKIYKSDYETLKYLLKIVKTDNLDDIFFEILSVTLKESNLKSNEKDKIIYRLNVLRKKSQNLKFKNILLNEIEILQKKTLLKSKPRKIHVLLTTACNLKCIMCYIPKKSSAYEINRQFIDFIVDTIPYLENITWQGGEVFLHNKFQDLFELAGKHNVKQNIITSGLLLNQKIIDSVMKYNTELTISIDSVDKQTYEKIRCGANFKQLLKNLEIIKKYKNKKYFNYNMTSVIMSLNYNQLDSLVDFAISHGFNLVSFQKVICNHDNKFLSLTKEQEKEVFKNINKLKRKYENVIKIQTDISVDEQNSSCELPEIQNNEVPKENKNNDDTLFCFAPWTQIFFDFDNVVKIDCNSIPLMLASKGGIWNNENIVTYRKSIIDKKFTYCNQFCYDNADHRTKTKKLSDI